MDPVAGAGLRNASPGDIEETLAIICLFGNQCQYIISPITILAQNRVLSLDGYF